MSNFQLSGDGDLNNRAIQYSFPAHNSKGIVSDQNVGVDETFRIPRLDLLARLLALGEGPEHGISKHTQPSLLLPESRDPREVFDQVKPFLHQFRAQGFAEIDNCRKAGTPFTPLAKLIFKTTLSQDLHEEVAEFLTLDPDARLDRPGWQRNLLKAAQKVAPIIDFCSPALAALERWELQSPAISTLGKIAGGMAGAVASMFVMRAGEVLPKPMGGVVTAFGAAASLTSYCFSQAHLFPLVYGIADRLEFKARLKECLNTDPKAVDVVNNFLRQAQEL